MSQDRSSNGPNIVVFGQTGSGKSSFINMLAGERVAKVSSDPSGCTAIAKNYDIQRKNKMYTFWDTCGLNEDEEGTVSAQKAADGLVNLLKGMTVNLIIYIARGHRFLKEVNANLAFFDRIKGACGEMVPIVLVVTGLEQEGVIDEWWTKHEKLVMGFKLSFKGHACVTTIKGLKNEYENEYQESTIKVWKLVEKHCNPSARVPTSPVWSSALSRNIILFGESGCGKSSIVNMIAGRDTAKVASSPVGCTFEHECHNASFDGIDFNIYDTVGLNEGEQGRVPHWDAIRQLYTLIRSLDGVSLLIYCMRGRIKENARANWMLFSKVLCNKKVPVIAVQTGMEHEEDLDGRRTFLRRALKMHDIDPQGIACVVSVRGRNGEHVERYKESQRQLRELIKDTCREEPWSMETDDWIGHIYKTTYTTKSCIIPDVRVEFANEVGGVVDTFIRESGMKEADSKQLKSTLLKAEKNSRKLLNRR